MGIKGNVDEEQTIDDQHKVYGDPSRLRTWATYRAHRESHGVVERRNASTRCEASSIPPFPSVILGRHRLHVPATQHQTLHSRGELTEIKLAECQVAVRLAFVLLCNINCMQGLATWLTVA